jgi:hypothetical protein
MIIPIFFPVPPDPEHDDQCETKTCGCTERRAKRKREDDDCFSESVGFGIRVVKWSVPYSMAMKLFNVPSLLWLPMFDKEFLATEPFFSFASLAMHWCAAVLSIFAGILFVWIVWDIMLPRKWTEKLKSNFAKSKQRTPKL